MSYQDDLNEKSRRIQQGVLGYPNQQNPFSTPALKHDNPDPRAALKSFARSLLALSYRDLVTLSDGVRKAMNVQVSPTEARLIAAAEAILEAP